MWSNFALWERLFDCTHGKVHTEVGRTCRCLVDSYILNTVTFLRQVLHRINRDYSTNSGGPLNLTLSRSRVFCTPVWTYLKNGVQLIYCYYSRHTEVSPPHSQGSNDRSEWIKEGEEEEWAVRKVKEGLMSCFLMENSLNP